LDQLSRRFKSAVEKSDKGEELATIDHANKLADMAEEILQKIKICKKFEGNSVSP
jgi:5'-3' exonuclease